MDRLPGRPYWNERVLELLHLSLLQSFTHVRDEQLRPTLVTHAADLCLYSATAAQPEYGILTAFLSSSSDADRKLWAQHIGWRLAKLQPAEAQGNWERWIKDYWARRLDNRPVRLTADEGGQMLDWVIPAGDPFPEAVGLLVKSPSRFPGAFLFFRNLKDSPVLTEHSAEAAQLAAHVLTPSTARPWCARRSARSCTHSSPSATLNSCPTSDRPARAPQRQDVPTV